MAHGRRCLNVYGRQVLVERIVHRGWSVTAADGVATSQIARDLGLSRPTVRLWRPQAAPDQAVVLCLPGLP